MKITIMGCGGSAGVPNMLGEWGKCNPDNPKNRRMRSSICVDGDNGTRIIVDTGPDFRQQMINLGWNGRLDAVLYTHAHADHIFGIDELRLPVRSSGKPVDIYGRDDTVHELLRTFPHIFEGGEYDFYPKICVPHAAQHVMNIGGMKIVSFDQVHGNGTTTGFRFGDFAYSTDAVDLPEESLQMLTGTKIWVIGMAHEDNPVHADKNKVLQWVERVKPEKVFLTHLNPLMDYETLCRELPEHIRPCYDGMVIEI